MKPNSWKDFVIKDVAWIVNNQIKSGDTIYRLKTDYIDIKGKMMLYIDHSSISIEFDGRTGILKNIKIKIVPEMQVFKTDSEDDPGILLQDHKDTINPELCVGKLYWIANSDLEFQSLMHVKAITDNSIDVNVISKYSDSSNKSPIKIIGKSYNITELLGYKFNEV